MDRIIASSNPNTLRGAVRRIGSLDAASAARLVERALSSGDSAAVVDAIAGLTMITNDRTALLDHLRRLADDPTLPRDARDFARGELESFRDD